MKNADALTLDFDRVARDTLRMKHLVREHMDSARCVPIYTDRKQGCSATAETSVIFVHGVLTSGTRAITEAQTERPIEFWNVLLS